MVGGGDCLPSLKGVYLGSAEFSSDFPMYHIRILFPSFMCCLIWFACFLDSCHSITWSLFS